MTSALLTLALLGSPGDVRSVLETQCRTRASDPTNPWALAHGIVAFGPRFRASDGRLATEVIVHDFARPDPARPGTFEFPAFEGGQPVDPHPNLLVKTLVDSGLPLSHSFPHAGGPITLGQLAHSVETRLDDEALAADWPSAAWTLDLLSAVGSSGSDRLEPAALAHLESAQAFLGEAMDHGLPNVPKARQGIWAEPCGGFHFIQAVMTAARRPAIQSAFGVRLARQQAILFYRLDAERQVYEQTEPKAPPDYVVPLWEQELKFYGHWLETVGRMEHEGVLQPTSAQRAQVVEARALLSRAVRELVHDGAFRRKPEPGATPPQLALDLTGDSCHALHGLDLTVPQ